MGTAAGRGFSVNTHILFNDLLDEALALPLPQRERWLEQLNAEAQSLRLRLKRVLDHAAAETHEDFLSTLPKITRCATGSGDNALAPTAVGAYRLIREIASGGMGSVWLAERSDGLVKRPVAVKFPRGMSHHTGLADRMGRERDILAVLNHPNIARLYDAGVTEEGQPWLALEYVEGEPIDQHCRKHNLNVRERLQLFLKVADAVAHAHAKLIVHRDLKPANVLVTPEGEVRLLDFGIAKLIEGRGSGPAVTEFSGRALTIEYASPEQILGEVISTASDIYSLGVMLFELLTGVRPHRPKDATRRALEDAILHAEPARLSDCVADRSLRRQLRGDLDTIVLRALKGKPEERYATVNAFADDIVKYLAGRPVQARPDSVWYRFGKFVGRNRLASAIAGVLLLVMLFITVATISLARSALVDQRRLEIVKSLFSTVFLHVDPNRPDGISLETLERALLDASQMTAMTVKADDFLRMRLEMRLALVQRRMGKAPESDRRVNFVLNTLERIGGTRTEEYVSAKLLQATFATEDGRLQEATAAEEVAERLAATVPGNDRDLTVQARLLLTSAKRTRGIAATS